MSSTGLRIVVLLGHLPRAPLESLEAGQPALGHGSGAGLAERVGPCDAAAVMAALAMRAARGGTVTALAVGPDERTAPGLRAALAAGCNRAVSVPPELHWPLARTEESKEVPLPASQQIDSAALTTLDDDDGVDAHVPLDFLGTAALAGAALKRLGCDLVLCGERSADGHQAAVGPAVAELLGMGHVSAVMGIEALPGEPALVLQHRGGTRVHRVRCPLPVVLCLLAASPAGTTEQAAAESGPAADILRLDPDELDVDVGRLHHLPGWPFERQPSTPRVVMLDSAAELVSRLAADRLVSS